MILYKGFDENFQCRGFQYEVGKTYTTSEEVALCERGFHACFEPIDALSFYTKRFAEVEMKPVESNKHKAVSNEITIIRELTLQELLNIRKPEIGNFVIYYNGLIGFCEHSWSPFIIGEVIDDNVAVTYTMHCNWNIAKAFENNLLKLPNIEFCKKYFDKIKKVFKEGLFWVVDEYAASSAWLLYFRSYYSYPYFYDRGKSYSEKAFFIINI